MTSIINYNPMKLLDRFIFSRLTDGLRNRQVCICTADTRGDKFSTGVTAYVDKSVRASAKSDLFLLLCI